MGDGHTSTLTWPFTRVNRRFGQALGGLAGAWAPEVLAGPKPEVMLACLLGPHQKWVRGPNQKPLRGLNQKWLSAPDQKSLPARTRSRRHAGTRSRGTRAATRDVLS
jgi:hypothetical protein